MNSEYERAGKSDNIRRFFEDAFQERVSGSLPMSLLEEQITAWALAYR